MQSSSLRPKVKDYLLTGSRYHLKIFHSLLKTFLFSLNEAFFSAVHASFFLVGCKMNKNTPIPVQFNYRVQARGRLGRNTRPDGVNFALEGSGGKNNFACSLL